MKKIPTVFIRNQHTHIVGPEVTPGCEWVIAGEGYALRKYDGTCRLVKDGQIWERRTIKDEQPAVPVGFVPVEYDVTTGKTVGWVPTSEGTDLPDGTYELCGPKVNGNPEGFEVETMVRHSTAPTVACPRDYDGLRDFMRTFEHEGVVFWRDGEPGAKLKRRDFG